MIEWRRYIINDPQICHGQLCAKGTRVLVTNISRQPGRRAKPGGHPAELPRARAGAHRCGHRLCGGTGARRKSASFAVRMKFKVDENLPAELLDDLRIAGHEAETVPEQGLSGAPDPAREPAKPAGLYFR